MIDSLAAYGKTKRPVFRTFAGSNCRFTCVITSYVAPPTPHVSPPAAAPIGASALGPLDRPLAIARDAYVAAYCQAVLAAHAGNREAAAALGISARSLYRYLAGDRD